MSPVTTIRDVLAWLESNPDQSKEVFNILNNNNNLKQNTVKDFSTIPKSPMISRFARNVVRSPTSPIPLLDIVKPENADSCDSNNDLTRRRFMFGKPRPQTYLDVTNTKSDYTLLIPCNSDSNNNTDDFDKPLPSPNVNNSRLARNLRRGSVSLNPSDFPSNLPAMIQITGNSTSTQQLEMESRNLSVTKLTASSSSYLNQSEDTYFKIAKSITSSLNLDIIINRVLSLVVTVVKAERCSLFLIDENTNELYSTAWDVKEDERLLEDILSNSNFNDILSPQQSVVTNLFKKSSESDHIICETTTEIPFDDAGNMDMIFEDNTNKDNTKLLSSTGAQFKFPVGVGIAGYVAQTGKGLNVKDAYNDPRFNKEFDLKVRF
jgi:hypothetical protein